ncbi:hypothetical protein DLD82_13050 [Methanospirillum stamsii]|uniref:Carboxypeptidase regulatory-like domain-containing protein n=2 Tax=Methanospirillum stamsii TaxID=1277351 RepID=A0A2V2N899_9EURY|nr:hypothetical protein DLD82_13050 [Methanospirillum stamsii]
MFEGFLLVPRFTLIFMVCLISLVLMTGGCSVLADKAATTLSIATDPVDPGNDLEFLVTGVLTDAEGNLLGNKKVTLEQMESDDQESEYSFLAVTTTDVAGNYSFRRPEGAPAEYLRVKFNGNDQFEGTVSEIVQGHKPSGPVQTQGPASSVVKSDTKITAKASPSNPSPGQTVVVTGQLIGENGTPLSGKEILCEASDRLGNRSDYEILAASVTDENGFFKFGVGGGSTTTYIQVHFTGDGSYEESYSDLIVVL